MVCPMNASGVKEANRESAVHAERLPDGDSARCVPLLCNAFAHDGVCCVGRGVPVPLQGGARVRLMKECECQ
jgi:hypothetical protein